MAETLSLAEMQAAITAAELAAAKQIKAKLDAFRQDMTDIIASLDGLSAASLPRAIAKSLIMNDDHIATVQLPDVIKQLSPSEPVPVLPAA